MNQLFRKQLLLPFLAPFLWTSGFAGGSDVTQPAVLWQNKSGDATIDCSHIKGPLYFQMYWFRQLPGKTMELVVFTTTGSSKHDFGSFSQEKFSATKAEAESGALTVRSLEPADEGLYFCAVSSAGSGYNEAYFGAGTKLTVLEDGVNVTGPEVKILRPSPNECRDQKKEKGERRKTLVCVASGFYPDHVGVFWQINGQDITDGVATDAAAKKDERTKKFSITSRLRLQAKTWFKPDNEFTCCVTFFNGKNYTNYPASIKPNETDTGMTREKYLKITQNAKLSYSALIVKSCLYAALVCLLVWRLQSSPKKRNQ